MLFVILFFMWEVEPVMSGSGYPTQEPAQAPTGAAVEFGMKCAWPWCTPIGIQSHEP